MPGLKYTIIKSKAQYKAYTTVLEELVFSNAKDKDTKDEIALLTLLLETWDAAHNNFQDADPIQLLRSLMKEHKIKAVELAKLLGVSEGLVSDILHYKKGLSKETIRILADTFKLNQEAFNRPYELKVVGNYEKHPFFIKKANAAKALLKTVGLPKQLAKAK